MKLSELFSLKENSDKIIIAHKEWKERGLLPPLDPEETPKYKFSDLQLTLYYKIYI